jgi:S-adenosylmethionine:tRNA ribosyltransferase-isomerase
MSLLDATLKFDLPPELEAHEPAEVRGSGRDDVRLLVSDRATDTMTHARFRDLSHFLVPGDLLVVNTSGTLPAEVPARTADGENFPLRLSTGLAADIWSAEPRGVQPDPDDLVSLPGGASARFLSPYNGSTRLWTVRISGTDNLVGFLLTYGRPIRYPYVPRSWPLDAYQTIFTEQLGSAEMPSAARPFTRETVQTLERKGVGIARIRLHCGVSSLESHEPPYPEPYHVSAETADAVNRTHAQGHRVIAIGTTVVRTLETVAEDYGTVHAGAGWTDLVVTAERSVRGVDGLLTGFHEPEATHLSMLQAIAGRAHVTAAYEAALECRYLWHEFGDVHLIL